MLRQAMQSGNDSSVVSKQQNSVVTAKHNFLTNLSESMIHHTDSSLKRIDNQLSEDKKSEEEFFKKIE
jgi:hypothetical protein